MSKDSEVTKEQFKDIMQEEYEKNLRIETLEQENKEISAEIRNTKLKIQKKELDKVSEIEADLEKEDLTEREFNRDRMLKDIEDRKNAIVFVNEEISKHFIAAPGSLIVVPSMTNNGKSTLTAHIAEAMIKDNKRVLILSNEEKEEDVRARVSCLRVNISFGDYKTNKCTSEQINFILDDAERLSKEKRLVVISPKNNADAYKVTTVRGVIATLEKAKGNFDAVLLDYYTNVNMSETGMVEPWHVNNRLASELNVFKDSAPFPIIAMAQCESIRTNKKVDDKGSLDFESHHPMYRWKGGKNILIYATDIIELTKDFENSCSYLYGYKVRFGHGELDRLHCLLFDKKMQRLNEWTPEGDAKITASKMERKSIEEGKELGLADIFRDRE